LPFSSDFIRKPSLRDTPEKFTINMDPRLGYSVW
jgi:hypothetical protein